MPDPKDETRTLRRPVGPAGLALIEASAWTRSPPRLPDQPIFDPVRYARELGMRSLAPRSFELLGTRCVSSSGVVG